MTNIIFRPHVFIQLLFWQLVFFSRFWTTKIFKGQRRLSFVTSLVSYRGSLSILDPVTIFCRHTSKFFLIPMFGEKILDSFCLPLWSLLDFILKFSTVPVFSVTYSCIRFDPLWLICTVDLRWTLEPNLGPVPSLFTKGETTSTVVTDVKLILDI